MKYTDMHTRSTCSTGSLSPAELVRRAHAAGLASLALTDYCSVAGLPEAAAEAEALGIEFLGGVELPGTLSRYERELRILGYGFDAENPALLALIESAKTNPPTLGQAAALIREAGGLVALANPESYGIGGMALDGFMQSVRCCGVEFMEVLYPGYTPDESQFWLDTAKEWSMDPIGGSGFGSNDAEIGECEVDYEVYAWLMKCRRE